MFYVLSFALTCKYKIRRNMYLHKRQSYHAIHRITITSFQCVRGDSVFIIINKWNQYPCIVDKVTITKSYGLLIATKYRLYYFFTIHYLSNFLKIIIEYLLNEMRFPYKILTIKFLHFIFIYDVKYFKRLLHRSFQMWKLLWMHSMLNI